MNRTVLTSRRWQLAFWGTQTIGAVLFGALFWNHPLSWSLLIVAWSCAWTTGFWAAVLVEIGTQ